MVWSLGFSVHLVCNSLFHFIHLLHGTGTGHEAGLEYVLYVSPSHTFTHIHSSQSFCELLEAETENLSENHSGQCELRIKLSCDVATLPDVP